MANKEGLLLMTIYPFLESTWYKKLNTTYGVSLSVPVEKVKTIRWIQ